MRRIVEAEWLSKFKTSRAAERRISSKLRPRNEAREEE